MRESTFNHWRRVLREERDGYQPTLDDELVEGMTYRQYFALSDIDQDALWDRVFGAAAWEIEDFEEVDVRADIPTFVLRATSSDGPADCVTKGNELRIR